MNSFNVFEYEVEASDNPCFAQSAKKCGGDEEGPDTERNQVFPIDY